MPRPEGGEEGKKGVGSFCFVDISRSTCRVTITFLPLDSPTLEVHFTYLEHDHTSHRKIFRLIPIQISPKKWVFWTPFLERFWTPKNIKK